MPAARPPGAFHARASRVLARQVSIPNASANREINSLKSIAWAIGRVEHPVRINSQISRMNSIAARYEAINSAKRMSALARFGRTCSMPAI